MPTKIPLFPNISFTDGASSASENYISDGIINIDDNKRPYLTQRPSFNQEIDASGTLATSYGRAIYYWGAVSAYYMAVNNGTNTTIYKTDYSTACTGTLGTGNSKVYFAEVGSYLCIIDPENNKGYYIDSSTSTTVTEITDVDFPPKQTPALQLAKGAVELKGRLYVMDTEGTIWNSASQDPTNWAGGDNIQAEIEQDGGVAIAKHNEQIVAFGERTIEYFYHAGNPTNSPLSSNQTVYHEIGAVDQDMLFEDNQKLYFIGQSRTGLLQPYIMENFQIRPIGSTGMAINITSELSSAFTGVYASGLTAEGRTFYVINSAGGKYVYDDIRDRWYFWNIQMGTGLNQNLSDWTIQTANQVAYGILINGDVISVNNDFKPYDISSDDSSEDIQIKIDSEMLDFGSTNRKFLSNIRSDSFIRGTVTSPWTLDVRGYIDGATSLTAIGTLDITDKTSTIANGGSFRQIKFFLILPYNSVSGTKLRTMFYGLEADIAEGTH